MDAQRRSMTESTGETEFEPVLSFLAVFETPGFAFGAVGAQPGQFPYVRMAPEVDAFVQTLYDNGWVEPFEWSTFQDEAVGYFEDPSSLRTADLATIGKLFTLHVRKDRFCEGHLLVMLEAGHIQAILRRPSELRV